MNYLFYLFYLFFSLYTYNNHNTIKTTIKNSLIVKQDSTLRERFIANILNEYDQEGRWVFVNVNRCENKSAYEIINPHSLYLLMSETTSHLDRNLFVAIYLQSLYVNNVVHSCLEQKKIYYPKASYELEGKKINMKVYTALKQDSISNQLKKYFNDKKLLKKKYRGLINELIAICYDNNIKVITSTNGDVRYEIFK